MSTMAVRLKEADQVQVRVEENQLCGFEMVSHGVSMPLEALMSDVNREKNIDVLRRLAVLRVRSEEKLVHIISNDKTAIPKDMVEKIPISIKILSTDFYNGTVTFSINDEEPRLYFVNANIVDEFQEIYTIIEQLGFSCGENGTYHKYDSSSKGPVDVKYPSFSYQREVFSEKSSLGLDWDKSFKCLTENTSVSKRAFEKLDETKKNKAIKRFQISKRIYECFLKNLKIKKGKIEEELKKTQKEPHLLSQVEHINKVISQVESINIFSIAFTSIFPFEVEESDIKKVPEKMLAQANERKQLLEAVVGNEFPEVVTDIAAMGVHEPTIVFGKDDSVHYGMVRNIYQKFCREHKVSCKTDSLEEGLYLTARRLDHSQTTDFRSITFFSIDGIPSGIARLSQEAEVIEAFTDAVTNVNNSLSSHEIAE